MAIPEEVRRVPRPKNTIIKENKNGGLYRYMVIQRIGCKRVNGRNIPINGPVIGHIINLEYVEGRRSVTVREITLKNWGEYEFFNKAGASIFEELKHVYDYKDAQKMYTIALLRVANPDIPDYMLSDTYDRSWLSVSMPDVALEKTTVSKFISSIGLDYAGRVKFMRNRMENFSKDHHLAIDGTIKNDTSICNTLSKASRKSREKGCLNVSVLYAFSIETGEPICSKVVAGNVIDSVAYKDFLTENRVTKGIVLADKGFPKKKAKKIFDNNKDLHWLNPLKRNDTRIDANDMYSYTGCLKDKNLDVSYKKVKVGDTYLYSFYNRSLAAREERDYYKHHKGDEVYDKAKWDEMKKKFGTIVFESDLDAPPEIIYKAYTERWDVEGCFRVYKQILQFDDTRVHSDASVFGTEFINFLSTCITMRVKKQIEKSGLDEKYTYREIFDLVSSAKKVRDGEDSDWIIPTITVKAQDALKALGLLESSDADNEEEEQVEDEPPVEVQPKHKGRPKGSKNKKKE